MRMIDELLGRAFFENAIQQFMFFRNSNDKVEIIFFCKFMDAVFDVFVLDKMIMRIQTS